MTRSAGTDNGIRYVETMPTVGSSGATFLLLHGLGGSLEQWARVAEGLGRSARTIAIDVPGFGQSRNPRGQFELDDSVARILRFCRSRAVTDCVVVSHSVGCVVAARLATRMPALFTRLVLVSGTLGRAARLAQDPLRALSHPRLGLFVTTQFLAGIFPVPPVLLRALASSGVFRTLTLWPFVAHPTRLSTDRLVETLTGSGSLAVVRILFTAGGIDYIGILSSVRQPVDLISGDEDRIINGDDIAQAHRLLRVAREHTIEGCGHWPWLENPSELVDFITARSTDGAPQNQDA